MPAAATGDPEAQQVANAGQSVPTVPGSTPGASTAEPVVTGGGEGGPQSLEERLRTRSTPLVRKIAAEHGVDVSQVPGTGRNGRVTKDDVLKFVEAGGKAPAAIPQAAPARKPAGAPAQARGRLPVGRVLRHRAAPRGGRRSGGPGGADEPHDLDHRAEHGDVAAHLAARALVLRGRLLAHRPGPRRQNRKTWEEQGVKVTYTAFIAWAVARRCASTPRSTPRLGNNEVSTAARSTSGSRWRSTTGSSSPWSRTPTSSRWWGSPGASPTWRRAPADKKLKPEEIQGGTFTITNPGIFGTTIGFPIISQPQVAILGVGGVEKRPAVITDEYGNDAIVPRKRGYISLGYDHRLVNGADADQFLARVKELMENFPEEA
jgi:pyruvate dehydrogenase E2 component (dihydrolipoamide acetyltransferase)